MDVEKKEMETSDVGVGHREIRRKENEISLSSRFITSENLLVSVAPALFFMTSSLAEINIQNNQITSIPRADNISETKI